MSSFVEIKAIADKSKPTLVHDAIGALALMVMLVVGLHLPSFF
ncbi:MAG: hypothetical protein V2I76_08585 [Roseobacter sp.]|nr:hypothetical protein [Roseobacter sp.]